jgi:metallo-beta-lactamase family protein
LNLAFLGGAGTVTGSRFLVESGAQRVLVDCGLFQGLKALRLRNWDTPLERPAELAAVVLTHAHLDHSGYLPRLAKRGFAGPVYCSAATADLCGLLLPDSGYLQEEEARYANRHAFSRHKPALPLYTEAEAREALKLLKPLPYLEKTPITLNTNLVLRPAGHILGASSVELDVGGTKLVFSGDLGRPADPIMHAPERVEEADFLVVESTYGNRRHPRADPERVLEGHLDRALARGGVVVIPAFAVGRAQELLYYIARIKARRAIPDVPVYLNSPMAIDATALHAKHSKEHRLSEAQCREAFGIAHLVRTPEESQNLNARRAPMIILSASGMATGGRVLHHLKAFLPDPKNLVLLPGFQAAGTRGASLAAGADEIKIHGEYVPVRAEVVPLEHLSAHADRDEILAWLKGFRRPPRLTFVVHGEPAAADELRRRIGETLGWEVAVPEHGQAFSLATEKRPGGAQAPSA